MPLTADQRHALLLADRTRDVGQITVVIERVLAANPDADLFDIELAFRDAACSAYVIAGPSKAFHVVTGGLSAMLAALSGREVAAKTGGAAETRSAASPFNRLRYGCAGTDMAAFATAQQCPMVQSQKNACSARPSRPPSNAPGSAQAADLACRPGLRERLRPGAAVAVA
jgi:hypothetical protein